VSDGAGLLRAILDDPADDTPRLVYADWLEENGDAGGRLRAEFIRLQIELAGIVPGLGDHGKAARLLARYRKGAPVRMKARTPATLLMRERAFYGSPGTEDWLPAGVRDLPPMLRHVVFRRGFVESVTLDANAWLEHGPALCALHPVTEVRLADKKSGDEGPGYLGLYFWVTADSWPESPNHLPQGLRGYLKAGRPVDRAAFYTWGHYYNSPEGATADLSRACVAWARKEAGLPPLPSLGLKSERV
jgi:uncharacterized protein (TIGR02996 family)